MSIKLRLAVHKIFNDAGQRYVSGAFVDGQDRFLCPVDGWADIKITPRRRPGRPPGSRLKPKDVAMYLCHKWFQGCQGLGKDAAGDKVAALMKYADWRSARRPVMKAEAMLPRDGFELVFSGEGDEGRLAIILNSCDSISIVNKRIVIDGTGWVWAYPEFTAIYGHIKGNGNFDPVPGWTELLKDMGVTIK